MLLTALFQVATDDIVRQAVSCYEMEYDIVPRLSVHSLNKLRERSGQLVGSYRVQVMMNLLMSIFSLRRMAQSGWMIYFHKLQC